MARGIAGDAAHRDDRAAVAEATRGIVAAVRSELRAWRGKGGAGQEVAVAWTRLVDAAVLEAYRMARFQSGQTSIVAPLTVVAAGAYGEQALRPDRPVPLLLIVPADRRELAGRRMARHLTQNLRAFGLAVAPTVTTGPAQGPTPALSATGRVIAGSQTLWAGGAVRKALSLDRRGRGGRCAPVGPERHDHGGRCQVGIEQGVVPPGGGVERVVGIETPDGTG